MATNTGISLNSVLPLPDNAAEIQKSADGDGDVSNTLADEATASHALAVSDPDVKGVSQESHDVEVKDLGWHTDNEDIPSPLVGGLQNDDLWVMLRRFNMQLYHVKELSGAVPGNLDLNIAEEEEFSPDKLRANVERLYMTVGIGLIGAAKHIARLRSWREKRRTAIFCTAYFLAWLLDLLAPLLTLTIVVLIVYPPSREKLFPPVPIALVNSKTGGVQKPKSGVLGSTDSATGAPEAYKGEAVEAEASHFFNSITSIALASASGKHPSEEVKAGHAPNDGIPDPTTVATGVASARVDVAAKSSATHKKARVPMETTMWNKMRPLMHGISDLSDTWERFGNALEPTPPFPRDVARLRIAGLVVPLVAASIFTTNYMLVKGITFGVGFGFFGDPVIQPAIRFLNAKFPHWQKILELRNTVLKGVPTNAQLTLTLLRMGEANKAPLPPPPHGHEEPPDTPVELSDRNMKAIGGDTALDADEAEIHAAIHGDPSEKHATDGKDIDVSKNANHGKKGHRVLNAMKAGVRGTVSTVLGADYLKAKAGSETSKRRLGVIPSDRRKHLSGPVVFKCRFGGKRGHAYISTKATIPCVSFSLDKSISEFTAIEKPESELNPQWSVAVADIKELKKIGGLGWKSKIVVGWALEREVADGLEIIDRQGNSYVLTAMVLRNELFNRLIAMGGQKWESW